MTFKTVSIGIRHQDCWHFKLSKALNATIVIKYVYTLPNGQLYSYQTIICDRIGKIEPLLREMPEIKTYTILSQSRDRAEVITWAEQSSITESITRANCVFVGRIVIRDGVENWHIVAPTRKELLQAIGSLEQYADIAYIRHGDTPVDENILTEKQSAVLRAALDAGYFDMPQRASIKDIAERMHTSASTASEHLRRAEKKVLENYVRM